jgi:hypothetical protein
LVRERFAAANRSQAVLYPNPSQSPIFASIAPPADIGLCTTKSPIRQVAISFFPLCVFAALRLCVKISFLLAAPKPGEGGSVKSELPRHSLATAGPQFQSNPVKPGQSWSNRFPASIVGARFPLAPPHIVGSAAHYTTNGGLPLPWTPRRPDNPQSAIRNPQSAIRNPQSSLAPISTWFHLIPLNSTPSTKNEGKNEGENEGQ